MLNSKFKKLQSSYKNDVLHQTKKRPTGKSIAITYNTNVNQQFKSYRDYLYEYNKVNANDVNNCGGNCDGGGFGRTIKQCITSIRLPDLEEWCTANGKKKKKPKTYRSKKCKVELTNPIERFMHESTTLQKFVCRSKANCTERKWQTQQKEYQPLNFNHSRKVTDDNKQENNTSSILSKRTMLTSNIYGQRYGRLRKTVDQGMPTNHSNCAKQAQQRSTSIGTSNWSASEIHPTKQGIHKEKAQRTQKKNRKYQTVSQINERLANLKRVNEKCQEKLDDMSQRRNSHISNIQKPRKTKQELLISKRENNLKRINKNHENIKFSENISNIKKKLKGNKKFNELKKKQNSVIFIMKPNKIVNASSSLSLIDKNPSLNIHETNQDENKKGIAQKVNEEKNAEEQKSTLNNPGNGLLKQSNNNNKAQTLQKVSRLPSSLRNQNTRSESLPKLSMPSTKSTPLTKPLISSLLSSSSPSRSSSSSSSSSTISTELNTKYRNRLCNIEISNRTCQTKVNADISAEIGVTSEDATIAKPIVVQSLKECFEKINKLHKQQNLISKTDDMIDNDDRRKGFIDVDDKSENVNAIGVGKLVDGNCDSFTDDISSLTDNIDIKNEIKRNRNELLQMEKIISDCGGVFKKSIYVEKCKNLIQRLQSLESQLNTDRTHSSDITELSSMTDCCSSSSMCVEYCLSDTRVTDFDDRIVTESYDNYNYGNYDYNNNHNNEDDNFIDIDDVDSNDANNVVFGVVDGKNAIPTSSASKELSTNFISNKYLDVLRLNIVENTNKENNKILIIDGKGKIIDHNLNITHIIKPLNKKQIHDLKPRPLGCNYKILQTDTFTLAYHRPLYLKKSKCD